MAGEYDEDPNNRIGTLQFGGGTGFAASPGAPAPEQRGTQSVLPGVKGASGFTDQAQSLVGQLPVVGGISDQLNGRGAFAPISPTNTAGAIGDSASLRGGFASQYGGLTPIAAPTMQGATINQSQSNQARGIQGSGLGTMNLGVGYQQAGAGVQAAGLGVQNQGLGVQRQGLGALNLGLGAQQQGLGVQQTGMSTLGRAGQSYSDVLAGRTPSVANLEGQKLQGQNIASMFGGAASARGVDRAGALRAAINGAGAANTQGAADAAINTAREQDAARAGLAGIGGAQVGAGSAMSGTGSAMGGIGQGIAGVGQGITAGGQGISNTGAGLSQTGAGIVNSGTQQTGAGTSIRNLDLSAATNQAQLDQGAAANNLNAATTTAGQNVNRENNIGTLTLGSQNAENTAAKNADEQALADKQANQKNQNGITGMVGNLIGSLF